MSPLSFQLTVDLQPVGCDTVRGHDVLREVPSEIWGRSTFTYTADS
jgi:hypothetical protein